MGDGETGELSSKSSRDGFIPLIKSLISSPLKVSYSNNQEEVFLGHSVTQSKNVSDETAKIIDAEVKRLIDEAKDKAKKILTDNIDELHIIAKGLLEYETLTGDEIKDLLKGIKPSRDDFDDSSPVPPTPKTSVPKSGSATAPQPN